MISENSNYKHTYKIIALRAPYGAQEKSRVV